MEAREAREKLAETAASELKTRYLALAAQVHPHFLFNTLNTISATLPPGFIHV
ncbi:histidine kinase [Asticcacaulis sp.]|uniref:histidine kinase n=1 Tax=Asticcacaulis sp. TaxID=1872648 RepID=UPI00391C8C6B